jgi:hypothetical protein
MVYKPILWVNTSHGFVSKSEETIVANTGKPALLKAYTVR